MILEHLAVAACASLSQSSKALYTAIKDLWIPFQLLYRVTPIERAKPLATKLGHLYVGSRICYLCGQIHQVEKDS